MVKNLPAEVGDMGVIPAEGNDDPLQYSYLGNPVDRGAWWVTVPGAAKESDPTLRLNNNNVKTEFREEQILEANK